MFGFKQFVPLTEQKQKKVVRGIQHLPHPAESAFASRRGAIGSALSKISSVVSGRAPVTKKVDDSMSFQVDEKGGVKYKGPGAKYNYSVEDIKRQYANKPYIAQKLIAIFNHIGKVLPKGRGEYQGGYLSSDNEREEKDGKISHRPNTIRYSVDRNSPEGKRIARSRVSIVLHSRILKNGSTTPIGEGELEEHPDVHVMSHIVSARERNLSPKEKTRIAQQISSARKLGKNHSYEHLDGHNETLLRYANSSVDTNERLSAKGYKRFLQRYHQKRIDSVKTEKAKAQKNAEMQAALDHVDRNEDNFNKTFNIYRNIQQATYTVANSLSRSASGGYDHDIDGQESSGEGFVSGNMKFVPRAFTQANRRRSAVLKAQKSVI